MKKVHSADGTTITFDQLGRGPAVVLVGGMFEQRAMDSETAQLAPLLAQTNARAFSCDASKPADIEKLFADLDDSLGAPEIVIYNPSFRTRGALILRNSAQQLRFEPVGAGHERNRAALRRARLVPKPLPGS